MRAVTSASDAVTAPQSDSRSISPRRYGWPDVTLVRSSESIDASGHPSSVSSRCTERLQREHETPYGGGTTSATYDLNKKFYRAAGQPKQLWRVPGAGHTKGMTAQPRAYGQRVVGFLDHALLGKE